MATTATATPPIANAAITDTRGRFAWCELMTTDPTSAETFYSDVIGWKSAPMEGSPMPYTLFQIGERPIAGLMAIPPDAAAMNAPPAWLGYIEVPDMDATVEQVKSLGGQVLMPLMNVEGVGRFAVLQDPQGASFAVITSAQPFAPETDPAPLEFSWHELTTTDLTAGINFYEQLFGWKKQNEYDMGDMGIYYMYGRDRFTYGGMMKQQHDGPGSYWLHYALVPDSADAAAERAIARGATIMVPPMEVPGGDRIAVLRDPQGAVFAVQSKKAM